MFRPLHTFIFSKSSLLLVAMLGFGFSSLCLATPAPSNQTPSFAAIMGEHLLNAQQNKDANGIGTCGSGPTQCGAARPALR